MTRREQLGMGESGIWTKFFEVPQKEWQGLLDLQTAPEESWRDLALRGGYPTPALQYPNPSDLVDREEIFAGYVQTYLERDIRDLSSIENLPDFQRLMRAAALRVGSIMQQANLANETGIPRTTIQRYLNLLEVSYQLVRVEPYSVNRTKRLVRSPKTYWSDTGLALHLAGGGSPNGAHLENLVLTDLLAWKETEVQRPTILYWRTSTGTEVDFVIEWKGKLLGIEVKATTNPIYDDAKGLKAFQTEYGSDVVGGVLLHGGDKTYWLANGVLATPWWKVM